MLVSTISSPGKAPKTTVTPIYTTHQIAIFEAHALNRAANGITTALVLLNDNGTIHRQAIVTPGCTVVLWQDYAPKVEAPAAPFDGRKVPLAVLTFETLSDAYETTWVDDPNGDGPMPQNVETSPHVPDFDAGKCSICEATIGAYLIEDDDGRHATSGFSPFAAITPPPSLGATYLACEDCATAFGCWVPR